MSITGWMVGMIFNVLFQKTDFYARHLSNLNLLTSRRFNKAIGLDRFKWVFKNTPLKFYNGKIKLDGSATLTDLIQLRAEMTTADVRHLIGFVFVVIFASIKSAQFGLLFGLMCIVASVFLNLYPCLLQQENKRRLDPLIARLRLRAAKQHQQPTA
jgi:hypothetical protein